MYGVVLEHIETFLDQARNPEGGSYPRFIEQAFRRYLEQGCWPMGSPAFAARSVGTKDSWRLRARANCARCLARRTADTAAWLVDHFLPEAGYRQRVLTFPYTMRVRLAADRHLLSTMLRVFLRVLFAWQRRRGGDLGIRDGRTGPVSFLQRFGSALNLTVLCGAPQDMPARPPDTLQSPDRILRPTSATIGLAEFPR